MSKNKFSKRLAASLIAAATIGSSGVLSSLTYLPVHAADTDNYAKLLQYSMYFYDGNMCGDDVDSASAFDWRGDCHTGDVVCPVTFVKAKVALEELDDGQVLSIKMNDGEPVQNVPRSIKEEGHKILKLIDNEDGTYNLIVKKVGD